MSIEPDRDQIKAEMVGTLGLFPPFFEPALNTPVILENLWQQTIAGYVSNPLPPAFMETLFVRLSPHCTVPYAIVCHPCILRPRGTTTEKMLELLSAFQIQTDDDALVHLQLIAAAPALLVEWPAPGSPMEEALFRCAEMVYLGQKPSFKLNNPERFGAELKVFLGPHRYDHLISFLAYVKTCHLWVEAHPELAFEAVKLSGEHLQTLLQRDASLAAFFQGYAEKIGAARQERVTRQEALIKKERADDLHRRLAVSLESSNQSIISIAVDGTILSWNHDAETLYGYSAEEVLGESILLVIPPEDHEESQKLLERLKSGEQVQNHETSRVRRDGRRIYVSVSLFPLKDAAGGVMGIVGITQDITERKQTELALSDLNKTLEKRTAELARANVDLYASTHNLRKANELLEKLVIMDPLTRLLNRRGLQQALTQEIRRAKRDGATCFALLVDLDNFKQINDTYGLTAGDLALTQIARQLKASLRITDHAGRIGGDEFLVLLPGTSAAKAILIAEKLRLAVSGTSLLNYPNSSVKVTACLGLVEVTPSTTSIEELLALTQLLLKKSKTSGKNKVSYDTGIAEGNELEERQNREDLLSILRRGDRFRVIWQPIMRLEDASVVGYEALSRLNSKEFEMPEDFFRISLQSNILTLVDHHCFKGCVAAASSAPPKVRMHLNIFPSTLVNIPVEDLLVALPVENRGTYCIEISEQQVLSDFSQLVEVVAELKQAGMLIAMDDVGFGRSSLESLILLQPNIIKIDKSWVQGVGRDMAQTHTMEKAMNVIRSIGADAVAEGIETSADLEALRKLGVPFGQGYLWGEPATATW